MAGRTSPTERSPGRSRSCQGTQAGASSACSPGSSTTSSRVTWSSPGTRRDGDRPVPAHVARQPAGEGVGADLAEHLGGLAPGLRGAAEVLTDQVGVTRGLDGRGAGLVDRCGEHVGPCSGLGALDRLGHGPSVPDARANTIAGHSGAATSCGTMEGCAALPVVRLARDGAVGSTTGRRRGRRPDGHHPLDVPRPMTEPIDAAAPAPEDPPPGNTPTGTPRKLTVTRVAAARSRELTGATVRRIQNASRADGAGESGLTHLLWVNALHMAGDAMIAVSLAGTLFFAAASGAQRGNVALYLLVTMAPFAVLAPVIGPALDRLQRGGGGPSPAACVGRAVLAVVMAAHFHDFWLYPAALGTLVLSKALNVLRAAVVPRVLRRAPADVGELPAVDLRSADRCALRGAGAGGRQGLGFEAELWVTAAVFVVGTVLAVRLPGTSTSRPARSPRTCWDRPVGRSGRRRRAVSAHVTTALRANAALRLLGGFLTIFAAFLVEATVPDGWRATLALGWIAAGGRHGQHRRDGGGLPAALESAPTGWC